MSVVINDVSKMIIIFYLVRSFLDALKFYGTCEPSLHTRNITKLKPWLTMPKWVPQYSSMFLATVVFLQTENKGGVIIQIIIIICNLSVQWAVSITFD